MENQINKTQNVDERENNISPGTDKLYSAEKREFDFDNSLTAIGLSASAILDDEEGKDQFGLSLTI